MKVLKFFITILFQISLITGLNAQYEEEGRGGEFFISPDFGLMIGTTTRVEFSPMAGYYLTDRLTLAVGGRYEYYNYSKKYYGIYGFETSIYGPRVQLRYLIIENTDNILPIRLNMGVFLIAEQELLSLERKYFEFPKTNADGRFWQGFTLVGLGISQQAGPNSYLNVSVLWDMDNHISSPYINPVIRIGFQIGIGKKKETMR